MPFKKLGSLIGRGRLLGREDYEFGPVQYRLDAFMTTRLKAGTGQLVAHPASLFDAVKAPQTFLELDSGERVQIVLTSAVARRAEFRTNGPIPGF
jgi:hypothetical protein